MAEESLQLALNIVATTDDPDVKKSVYGLFGSLTTVIKGDIAGVLPAIINHMLASIKSSEGIISHFKDDEEQAGFYDDLSDEEAEEDIEISSGEENEEDFAGYSVENAYVEEKEEACLALREISEYAGAAFLPFLEKCYEEIFKLLNYPQEDIRKAAVSALLQFCLTLSKVNAIEGREALLKALQVIFIFFNSKILYIKDSYLFIRTFNNFYLLVWLRKLLVFVTVINSKMFRINPY